MNYIDRNFELALKGETLVSITDAEVGSEEIIFKTLSGKTFKMYHEQDCCENVSVQFVRGNVEDYLNKPIRETVERIVDNYPSSESATKTIFSISTGWDSPLVIEWLGESNGYYSESVSFMEESLDISE